MTRLILWGVALTFFIGASCKTLPDDNSAFASNSGQSTIVLGSCSSDFSIGWNQCLIEDDANLKIPTLKFVTTNESEWAVSDCELGIYKTGSTKSADLVEIDLSDLSFQLKKNRMCILKIEIVEKYKDRRDQSQTHSIYMRGGMFIELIDKGFIPTPSPSAIAFCVKVYRTVKGRTIVETCSP